jgi:hypothetical protein
MPFRAFGALVWLFTAGIVAAQQPAAPSPAQPPAIPDTVPSDITAPTEGTTPQLTPEQQREREIEQIDPLNRQNSANPSGQNPNETESKEKDKARSAQEKPLPGSIAAEQANAVPNAGQGPAVEEDDQNPDQQYTGPAVLSRSYTINRPMVATDVKWVESIGLNAIYDTGLTGTTLTSTGMLAPSGILVGTSLSYGLRGRHVWRRDLLGINFSGQYSQYIPVNNSYNGLNSVGSVDYTHTFSRRLSVTLVGNGTIYSQNYNLESSVENPSISVADINLASSPNIQIFDTTTKQFSLQTNVTWQKSTRLSFSFGGSYFGIDRHGLGLVGATGQGATGDMNYRMTYRTTVGVYYSYGYYEYPHGLDTSDTSSYGGIYSYAFSRSLQLRVRGGVAVTESLGQATVQLNPLIAALLGTSTGILDEYHKSLSSDISAQIVKDFRNGRTASIAYAHGISPGNGVYLTSEQETLGASGAMKIFRNYLVTAGGTYNSLSSIAQTVGKYSSESATLAFTRQFRAGAGWTTQLSYRYFNIGDNSPVKNEVRISTGISWASRNGRLWPF